MIGEELFISVGSQVSVFLSACLIGARIALVYECFRFVRCILKHGEMAVAVEDVLFCIVAAIYSFNFWLYAAKGELRGFIILGEWLGAAIYFLTIGRLAERVERLVSKRIQIIVLRLKEPLGRTKKAFAMLKNKCVKSMSITHITKSKNLYLDRKITARLKAKRITQKKRKIKLKTS